MFQSPDWYSMMTPEQMRRLSTAATPSVTSPMTNEDGTPAPDRQLNPATFAPREVADQLSRQIGGRVVQADYQAYAPSAPQFGLSFADRGGNSNVLNAGLVRDRIAAGIGRGENPGYVNEAIASETMNWAPGAVRNTAYGVQPTAGAMTSADAERMYGGDPRFDPNVSKTPRTVPNYRMGAGGPGGGPTGVDDGPMTGATADIPPGTSPVMQGASRSIPPSRTSGIGRVGGTMNQPPVRTPGASPALRSTASPYIGRIGGGARPAIAASAAPATQPQPQAQAAGSAGSAYARARQRLGR